MIHVKEITGNLEIFQNAGNHREYVSVKSVSFFMKPSQITE